MTTMIPKCHSGPFLVVATLGAAQCGATVEGGSNGGVADIGGPVVGFA